MGLSFHYKGSFKKGASLSAMIDEAVDVAVANNWDYHVFEKEFSEEEFGKEKFNDNMYGLCFSPPGCEPLWLSFLSNGVMASVTYLQFYDSLKKHGSWCSTKTQYAGIEVHMALIDLLKYLSPKYFENFTLSDEGGYWETGSEEKLRQIFGQYDRAINALANVLENTTPKEGESLEDAIKRAARDVNLKGDEGTGDE